MEWVGGRDEKKDGRVDAGTPDRDFRKLMSTTALGWTGLHLQTNPFPHV